MEEYDDQDTVPDTMVDTIADTLRRIQQESKMEEEYLKRQCEKLKLRRHFKNTSILQDKTDVEEIFEIDNQENFVQNVVEKYHLEKLKTYVGDRNIYYYDRVLNYIWKTKKDSETSQDMLIKPTDKEYSSISRLNSIVFEPYIIQPEVFW